MRVEVVFIAGLLGCGRIGFDSIGDGGDSLDVGLVGHWPFDESGGSRTADLSGFSNPGMLVGGVGFVAGRIGRALDFNGVDARVDIEETAGVLDMGLQSFSYSLWVYVPSSVGMFDIPWWRGGSSTFYPGYDMELGTSPWRASLSDGVTLVLGTFGQEILNQWALLTVVVDRAAGTMTLYVDGGVVDVQPVTIGSLSGSSTAHVGATATATGPFRGVVDDVRVYNRPLAAGEVDALYRAR